MDDLSLHVLDIAENCLTAGADRIDIRIVEDSDKDLMIIEIKDNGRGMDQEERKAALDPFYTTKPNKRVGMGLPMFAQAAKEAAGGLEVETEPGNGTLVRATFQLSHPDRKPLGDMLETISTLLYAHPKVQFSFEHRRNGKFVCRWDNIESDRNVRTN